ncbi:MAG: methylmalonyl Co-A mutase-associated GTPase MeaB, partial [Rhodospirillales bacterium]
IRPSPSGGTLGGVARRTRESLLLCEAAGFGVIVVETVGVGQSETAVADMVDMFLLLLAPGGGDELQGIKKGIVELADLVVVNKADGDLAPAAERARMEYASALHLLKPAHPKWSPKVLKVSARDRAGIDAVWSNIGAFREALGPDDGIRTKRAEQARAWMWSEITEGLVQRLKSDRAIAGLVADLEAEVMAGQTTPGVAAGRALDAFIGR